MQMVALQNQAAEFVCSPGSGIDSDPVGMDLDIINNGVPVHDLLAKVLLAIEKLASDPQQIF